MIHLILLGMVLLILYVYIKIMNRMGSDITGTFSGGGNIQTVI